MIVLTRRRLGLSLLAGGAASALAPVAAAGAPALPTAFLPFSLLDTSRPNPGERPDPADVARLQLVRAEVIRMLEKSGEYAPVDLAPIARAITQNDFYGCAGCAVQLAGEVHAKAVVTGLVQKISLLIVDMSITIRAVPGGRVIAAGSAGLRGDNDLAWQRAAAWLVAYRLLP
ncbi:MAG: DUF3280 domain-containing protein [Acetobacteraceae bacterium]